RTRKADQHHELAAQDVERDAVEGASAARIGLYEVLDRNDRRHPRQSRESTKAAGAPAAFVRSRDTCGYGLLLGDGATVAAGRGVAFARVATSTPASFAASLMGS